MTHSLFAYGTLQAPGIMERLLQRSIDTPEAAVLHGFQRTQVKHAPFPGIQPAETHQTQGAIYTNLTDNDLHTLDHYEGDLFQRIQVIAQTATSPFRCWVYVIKPEHRDKLSKQDWSLSTFIENDLDNFLKQ